MTPAYTEALVTYLTRPTACHCLFNDPHDFISHCTAYMKIYSLIVIAEKY